ncbi:MAG: hypothetical protein HOP15_15035 [Planctomycetes bacterium]|nr:hypothetical protein [Planctomycetota bacterium]
MAALTSIVSLCMWLLLAVGSFQEPHPSYFQGTLALGDRRFEIGLRFDTPAGAPRVDLVSCWWLDAPVEGFRREGNRALPRDSLVGGVPQDTAPWFSPPPDKAGTGTDLRLQPGFLRQARRWRASAVILG